MAGAVDAPPAEVERGDQRGCRQSRPLSPTSRSSYTSDATDVNIASTIEDLLGIGSDGGYDYTTYFPPMYSLLNLGT